MINVGVVGCGYWGPKHIRIFHELTGAANLKTVCDLEVDRLRQIQTQYPHLMTISNFSDLLQDSIDALVIATPVSSHYNLAKQALLHKKHVFVEKPLTSSTREAMELIELAERQNLVLMVGHIYEYHPAVSFLRKLIQNGELGEIYDINAARLNLGLFRPDVNVIWDLAPHDTGIVLSLMDKEPIAVSARGTGHIDPDICDVAYMELVFPNGTTAHIHVSWLDPRKVRQLSIVASKKMAVYDDVSESEKIRIYDKGIAFSPSNDGGSAWPPHYRYGDVTIPLISNAEPLKLECSHFLDCIAEGKKPRSDGRAGLRVVNILEAATNSFRNGGRLEEVPSTAAIPAVVMSEFAEVIRNER